MNPYAKTFHMHSSRAIANQVRDLYFKARFKQSELAKLYGLTQGTISKMVSRWTWI